MVKLGTPVAILYDVVNAVLIDEYQALAFLRVFP
jgi:hypothetical protein